MVLGRSGYVSAVRGYPLGQLSMISVTSQFITLWVGLVLGTIGVIVFNGLNLWGTLITGLLIFLSLTIFSTVFHKLIILMTKKILKKNLDIPILGFGQTLKLLPWFSIPWLSWAVGFYFLVSSLVPGYINPFIGLAFPLAGTLGILAIIAPGGIGVREGLLAGYLNLAGMDIQQAAVIAITSRLWFLVGEVAIFSTGIIIDRLRKKNSPA